ncbi:MAG TPA: metallophosphoesterase, partial [Stellaceae bacterium]|nr:metallophosphoesterase [Stellaceae bacterium]
NGYVFADFDPQDASGKYIPDNDNKYKTPFVVTRSKLHLRGPVPTPRAYPTMELASVVGDQPPGYTSDANGEQIAFDVVGDSGAPKEANLERYELKVTDLMSRDAQTSPPAFLFHVGDVVYYYGEENYYYSQFYDPFRAYPAPIFAIPGNHDAITYDDQMVSLASFQQAFCATTPGRWEGSGGIMRSTMTQPGVYFTLDAPLVSIIGLYSNWGESLGWIDEQQVLFLYKELVRLKALRRDGLPAVILAIHHFPRWFPGEKDPNSTAIDAACKRAGFWPDAVICGHAHLYQRVVRQNTGRDIPYVMAGSGGYGIQANEEVGKPYMTKLGANSPLGCVITKAGYVRATVASPKRGAPTLRFDYHSVQPTSSGPDDSCTINLSTNRLA